MNKNFINGLREFKKTSEKIHELLGWEGGNNFDVSYNSIEMGDISIRIESNEKMGIDFDKLEGIKKLCPEFDITVIFPDENNERADVFLNYFPSKKK